MKKHVEIKHPKALEGKIEIGEKCSRCKYVTQIAGNLVKHFRAVHLKERNYKCDACDFQAFAKSHLSKHQKSVHDKIKDQKCQECEYVTSDAGHLKRHVKSVHLKLRDYKCKICDFKTSLKYSLTNHVRAIHDHDKAQDVKCNECDYATSFSGNLRKHTKAKHLKLPSIKHEWTDNTTSLSELNQDRKEIVIVCHKCDFSTSSGQALTKHMEADHSSLTSRKYDRGGTALKGIKVPNLQI